MDATYPESGRLLALAGAQVICYPTNWVGRSSTPDHRWLAQAFENGVYWIAANRSDEERGLPFTGNTCILNPDGRIQAVCSGGEGIVYGEIDLDRTNPRSFDEAQVEEKLLDRRPDLYRPVLQNTYGWSPTYFQRLYGSPGLPAPRTSRVAALQLPPAREKPERAIQYIRRLLGAEAVDLLVLPELALTGAPDGAETSWDDALSALVDLAREREVLIVTSVFEPEGARRYNTVVLVGGKGLLARQRKHRLTRDDRSWATPGDQTPAPVDTPLGRLGLIGGYDALFWETLRVLACADIICIPAALRWPEAIPLPANRGTWIYWRAKAWESCAALAVANYPVPDFAGESGVFVPDVREDRSREAVAGVEGERLVCLAVDTGSRYIREKRSLSWRHLHLYTPLVVPHDVQIRRVPPRRPRAASG
jgi:predicted amidohydrolase